MAPGRQRFGDVLAAAHGWMVRSAAIGPSSRRARRFARFGSGSVICFPPAALFGEAGIRIGAGVSIGPNVSLSAGMTPGQQLVSDEIVTIGDRCLIGRSSSIVGHYQIDIGADVYFGPNVYVTDQNHSRHDPDLPIGRQSAPERPVAIGPGSWIGDTSRCDGGEPGHYRSGLGCNRRRSRRVTGRRRSCPHRGIGHRSRRSAGQLIDDGRTRPNGIRAGSGV
jgi:acetyltransferase-like isoleucine patch superfamily enzyme